MMRLGRSKHVLGLALDEHAVHVAEVGPDGEGHAIVRAASLEMGADLSWDRPAGVSEALRRWLGESGCVAREVVAGLPASWVLARPQVLPPTSEAAAIGVMRLAMEREIPGDLREWVGDVEGQASSTEPRTMLLVATSRRRLDQMTEAMAGAGVMLRGVTCTPLALTRATAATGAAMEIVVRMLPEAAEVAVWQGRQIVAMDRVSAPALLTMTERIAAIAAGIRRMLAGQRIATNADGVGQTTIWDASGAWEGVASELGEALGSAVRVNPKTLRGVRGAERLTAGVAGAASVAVTAWAPRGQRVNFLDSRLALAPPRRITVRRAMAGTLVAAVLLVGGSLVWDWNARRASVAELEQQLAAMEPALGPARELVDRHRLAQGWYDKRPAFLDCFRELTLQFPENGQVWASSLAVREDMNGTLAGKAVDDKSVLQLRDRLAASPRFDKVKLLYQRYDDRNRRVVSFAMTFAFKAEE